VVKFRSSAALRSTVVEPPAEADAVRRVSVSAKPLTALIVVPTLQAGAAEAGALELVRILAAAGHRPIVVSSGGRMENEVTTAGGELVRLDVASKNPAIMLRNAVALARLVRSRGCDVVHAHGRAPAWSAYLAARWNGVPFLTSWYKAFSERNAFKRFYNSVMTRGDRVIAVSDQIAEIIAERYRTPWERITVVPTSIEFDCFDPAAVSRERVETVRAGWGAKPETKIILVVGRMLRRKGHHVVVAAACRLKEMGLKDFLCVFIGEDHGSTRYFADVWDFVLASRATDVIRMAGPPDDLPAAYAAATVVVSAAVQAEGLQRAILEAQAMARPVIVSDLGAGPEVVLAPPAVSEDRMTGLRFSAGDDAGLAAALVRLFSLSEPARRAMGLHGREWVLAHFNPAAVAEQVLRLYGKVVLTRRRR
jgi:glycosyltransferase involved in cell wall biosynthesis